MNDITSDHLEGLIHGIRTLTGYDFSGYSKASLKRRVASALQKFAVPDLPALLARCESEHDLRGALVEEITVNVTEMFRDPSFFRSMREKVIPVLATYPRIKIWNAGCSSGEEIYSFAILLEEAGLLSRCTLYGTDINQRMLDLAKEGIYKLASMEQFERQYRAAGGARSLSDYYTVKYGHVKMARHLSERMVFGLHNLVTDSSFNQFHLVVCRNVLIYFDKALQDRVISLLKQSLALLGFLGLGGKESLKFSACESSFAPIDRHERIYRRVA